jgi:RNA-directed DNA polymerase
MNTALQPMYEWSDIVWRKLERNVFKLQKRIYQASNRGDAKLVRRLQKLLINSWSIKRKRGIRLLAGEKPHK